MSKNLLQIKNLHVWVEDKKVLNGVNLKVKKGELHAIMGPNGSGKSTLAFSVLGHPGYRVTRGEISFQGKRINSLSTDKRAQLGIFLGFQHPLSLEGVTMSNLVQASLNAIKIPFNIIDLYKNVADGFQDVGLDRSFSERSLNQDFSGGEKKKTELLQLKLLQPRLAILDEIDTGLDVGALKRVAGELQKMRDKMGIVLITHYQRILKHLKPDFVHVIIDGRIVKSGDYKLAQDIESRGYEWIL